MDAIDKTKIVTHCPTCTFKHPHSSIAPYAVQTKTCSIESQRRAFDRVNPPSRRGREDARGSSLHTDHKVLHARDVTETSCIDVIHERMSVQNANWYNVQRKKKTIDNPCHAHIYTE